MKTHYLLIVLIFATLLCACSSPAIPTGNDHLALTGLEQAEFSVHSRGLPSDGYFEP
jgi:hypothetical protein